jgi:recombination protein RecA
MTQASDVSQALAALQARWGAAAPRRWGDAAPVVHGALAMAPLPVDDEADDAEANEAGSGEAWGEPAPAIVAPANPFAPATRPGVPAADLDGRVVPTGFAALDAVLGTGGLPRSATVALRGGASSGRTTLALRVAAEAQAAGSIVAWLDLARAFDAVEAVARGVRPEWLVVLVPRDLEEALALAGSLLAARTVDLLVLDLPEGRDPAVAGARVGDRLGRLAALARRAGALLVVLAPDGLGRGLAAAVDQASGLRLELHRSGWIRLGRDVVGQRCRATVARNRYGPPGRDAELDILYADGGPRDGCLARPDLLTGLDAPAAPPGLAPVALVGLAPGASSVAVPDAPPAPPGLALAPAPTATVSAEPPTAESPAPPGPIALADRKGPHLSIDHHASAVPALAASAPPPRTGSPRGGRRHLRLVADRSDRPRRTALDGRDRPRRGSARPGARRPAGDPAGVGAPPGARGGLPGPDA